VCSEPDLRVRGSSGVILRNSMYLFHVLLLAMGLAACAEAQSAAGGSLRHYDLNGPPSTRIELPAELAEVSGLAFTEDGRLLAHGDERAVIYQIDVSSGKVVKRFAIGDAGGPLLEDFEDIQVVGDRVFLVTSAGVLVEAKEGRDGETVPVLRRSRGLRGSCEVEGLSWDGASSSMLLLCKQTQGKRWKDQLVILAMNPATGEFEPEPRLAVSHADLKRATGVKRFAGSAMVRDPRRESWILVSGPDHVYAEIDPAGKVLAGGQLPAKRHRQPEGLAIGSDHTLLISDEAAGARATITGYAGRR
jgi:uncharacterized protein YjiK